MLPISVRRCVGSGEGEGEEEKMEMSGEQGRIKSASSPSSSSSAVVAEEERRKTMKLREEGTHRNSAAEAFY